MYTDPETGGHRYMVPVLLGGFNDAMSPSTRLDYVTAILEGSGLLDETGTDSLVSAPGHLKQNAPNPFNPMTTIAYSVGRDGARVAVGVYDVSGRLVTTLFEGTAEAGEHAAVWDGTDSAGRPVASGVYFCRLSVEGSWSSVRKMVLLK
jgi:hypothetical protein